MYTESIENSYSNILSSWWKRILAMLHKYPYLNIVLFVLFLFDLFAICRSDRCFQHHRKFRRRYASSRHWFSVQINDKSYSVNKRITFIVYVVFDLSNESISIGQEGCRLLMPPPNYTLLLFVYNFYQTVKSGMLGDDAVFEWISSVYIWAAAVISLLCECVRGAHAMWTYGHRLDNFWACLDRLSLIGFSPRECRKNNLCK